MEDKLANLKIKLGEPKYGFKYYWNLILFVCSDFAKIGGFIFLIIWFWDLGSFYIGGLLSFIAFVVWANDSRFKELDRIKIQQAKEFNKKLEEEYNALLNKFNNKKDK